MPPRATGWTASYFPPSSRVGTGVNRDDSFAMTGREHSGISHAEHAGTAALAILAAGRVGRHLACPRTIVGPMKHVRMTHPIVDRLAFAALAEHGHLAVAVALIELCGARFVGRDPGGQIRQLLLLTRLGIPDIQALL